MNMGGGAPAAGSREITSPTLDIEGLSSGFEGTRISTQGWIFMKHLFVSTVLAASCLYVLPHAALADGGKKGAPTTGGGSTASAPAIKLSELKPGQAVRVKWRNQWVDGKVVQGGESQIQVQIGGSKDWFMAEKVWGTEEQQDAEAAGGYLDPRVSELFGMFKDAVVKLESVKRSGGDAAAVQAAIEAADEILKRDYGKAGQHPRVGPYLARYWAIATVQIDAMVAEAVAAAKKAGDAGDINQFAGHYYGRLDRAKAVYDEYRAFQTTPNDETARLDKLFEDAKQQIEAAKAKAEEAAIAAARLPKETYKGKDAKALKAKVTAEWKKQFPDRKILKLIIVSDWVRDRRWLKNASAAGGYWYDWSAITMYLVTKKDETRATVYPVGVSYEQENKKKLVVSATDKGFNTYAVSDMLLKNVK
jgi:hypothetical protein